MGEEILRLENVTKKYENRVILDKINLSVDKGNSIAIMGNNGCGKSTLLKVICKMTNINSGKIINCKDVTFSYIPEYFTKLNITAEQYIYHMGRIDKIPKEKLINIYRDYFHEFGMEDMIDIPIKHLSKGTLQKVAVIQAFLNRPDVLLLDEPLSGQDFKSQNYFIKKVNELKNQGVAIIMSCHEMFLVNQISEIVYCIENHNLKKMDIPKMESTSNDLLIFYAGNNKVINKDLLKDIARIEYNAQEIQLLVRKDKSNIIIMEMLKEGYRLKSITGVNV